MTGRPDVGSPHLTGSSAAGPVLPAPLRALQGALNISVVLTAVFGFLTTIVWTASGGGYYWPCWVWLAGLTLIALPALTLTATALPAGHRRWLLLDAVVCASIAGFVLLVWLFAGAGRPFWPVWPWLGLATVLVLHALALYGGRLVDTSVATRRLTEQVQNLTRTRRGALDVQAEQLRRIERDLHDGAQARLVALSIQLGRAEARLADDPEVAALVRSARAEAGAAVAELRDLVRGIAPPVLTDRGLPAAVQSLAERCPAPVTVAVEGLADRLPPVIESAAYFVVAESLTNVAKHAPGASAEVVLTRKPDRLILDVLDSGPGGASTPAAGGSTGLAGLRSRVEALDGRLTVESPPGGPTVVHAELPCES